MIPVIPRSQPLRFVLMNNYQNTPRNHDNRLLHHAGRSYEDVLYYCKKFDYDDNIQIQFNCDYNDDANNPVVLKLYNLAGTLIGEISLTKTEISTGLYLYNAQIVTTNLLGHYYCTISFSGNGKPTYLFQCDYIEVGDFDDLVKIQYRERDDDGIYYSDTLKFCYRIEADITAFNIATEIDQFKSNNSVVNAYSRLSRATQLKTDPISLYDCEHLDLVFSHERVWINEVEIVAAPESEMEPIEGTIFYSYSRVLTEATYEDYTITTTSSEVIPASDKYISTDGTKALSPDGLTYITSY